MSSYFNLIKDEMSIFWNGGNLQWLFCAALVVIAFLEKDPKKRQVMFWYPLVLYVFLISPILIPVANVVWKEDVMSYICRQFSMVPIFLLIAYAISLVLKRLHGWRKMIAFGLSLCLVWACSSGLVYTTPGYVFEKSENAYKIPDGILEICDYMDTIDEDPVFAINTNYAFLIRQYDPSVHLLIGPREFENKLSNELASETPNVSYVMRESCARGADFVAAKNVGSAKTLYSEAGYEPLYETNEFLLYEVSGYPGFKTIYNEMDQIVETNNYDENGQPVD